MSKNMERFDAEICLMNQMRKMMDQLDPAAQIRVLDWAKARAIDFQRMEALEREDFIRERLEKEEENDEE